MWGFFRVKKYWLGLRGSVSEASVFSSLTISESSSFSIRIDCRLSVGNELILSSSDESSESVIKMLVGSGCGSLRFFFGGGH